MTRSDHIEKMNELSASERIFTSAQAERLGITRKALSQAAASDRAERIAHGAYRLSGTPSSEIDELTAVWKLTNPTKFTSERMARWDGVVVGGSTASSLLGIGDFWLSPYRLYAPRRINSRLSYARFSKRVVDEADVTWLRGLPVTRLERTLMDLCLDFEDSSLVENALRDATREGIDFEHLRELISKQPTRGAASTLFRTLAETGSSLREGSPL
jgi:predicted transcriptional regulator of viral defense system